MASYHLEAKVLGRSKGRSAVAAAAYRSGSRIDRAETGKTYDYRRKGGVISTDLLVPIDAPDWTRDRSRLWGAVEAKERRKNSQLAREIIVALPHELTPIDARALVLAWTRDQLVSRGMVADVCIHDPDPGKHGNRNIHAHILLTMRALDAGTGDGWARNRERAWNDVRVLEQWRESWADFQNAALASAGSNATVDHRSLDDQRDSALVLGDMDLAAVLDRPPEPRLGVAASSIERSVRRDAERRSVDYQPVTDRGQDLAAARSARRILVDALDVVRRAGRAIVAMMPVPVRSESEIIDPFAIEFDPDPDDGPSPG